MKISVIIPALNEEKLLPNLLASIKRQKFKDYEVIVADAGSTDQTKSIAQNSGALVVQGGRPAVGRNNGAKIARGEFFYFLDADVVMPSDFLRNSWDEMFDRMLDVASCNLVPKSDLLIDQVLHSFVNTYIIMSQFNDPLAGGACILINRRLFNRIGGFDENLSLAEDHDLIKRAARFRHFRLLFSTYLEISVRRLEKEGRMGIIKKYMTAELYRRLFGKIKKDLINYDFGKFEKKENIELERKLLKIDRSLQNLGKEMAKIVDKHGADNQLAKISKIVKQYEKKAEEFICLFD